MTVHSIDIPSMLIKLMKHISTIWWYSISLILRKRKICKRLYISCRTFSLAYLMFRHRRHQKDHHQKRLLCQMLTLCWLHQMHLLFLQILGIENKHSKSFPVILFASAKTPPANILVISYPSIPFLFTIVILCQIKSLPPLNWHRFF